MGRAVAPGAQKQQAILHRGTALRHRYADRLVDAEGGGQQPDAVAGADAELGIDVDLGLPQRETATVGSDAVAVSRPRQSPRTDSSPSGTSASPAT